ncbi:MAG: nucleoside triphosphate pyrophosphohydrolase family protein [Planctomycetaceae bacterium]|nr:nucleoside triphosphate pyrophosphohydrolase family protein [Planctomycetaceae bacterium]
MDSDLTFREYQREAARTDQTPGDDLKSMMVPLLGLAGEAGSLLTEYKKWLREGGRYKPFTDQVSEEIGDILWYLANIAGKAGLDLQEIAEENLAKLHDRWAPADQKETPLFVRARYDDHFPETEQLPLSMRVEFRERIIDGTPKLVITCDGKPFGDPLTDNSHIDDGYRYHDVFHVACAILLGWSPIVRKLLKVKRKSVPQIDEVEDGARSAAIEEAISAFTFGVARDYSFFDGSDSVEFGILRTIRIMTRSLEVRDKSLRDWEEVILQTYAVWKLLVQNRGGAIIGDAIPRTLRYEAIHPDQRN